MEIVNYNFEKIENNDDINLEIYILKMVKFVAGLGIDKETINQIYSDLKEFVCEYASGDGYYTNISDGIKEKAKLDSSIAACAGSIKYLKSDGKVIFTPGLVLRVKAKDSIHTFTHEAFHALSMRTTDYYDENGGCNTKIGLSITKYDKNEKCIEEECDALNEGMTELLTRGYCKNRGKYAYQLQVVICKIISNVDTSIINAYFSRNESDVYDFLNKFEENQTTLSAQDLKDMSKDVIYDKELVYKYLKGVVEYNLNLTPDDKKEEQIEKLKKIVRELDNHDYWISDQSYVDYIDKIVKEINSDKTM